jgi:hypothetical protein
MERGFSNWQITVCLVVQWLQLLSRENGDVPAMSSNSLIKIATFALEISNMDHDQIRLMAKRAQDSRYYPNAPRYYGIIRSISSYPLYRS